MTLEIIVWNHSVKYQFIHHYYVFFYSMTLSVTSIWLQSFNYWIRACKLVLNGNVNITKVNVTDIHVTLLLLSPTHVNWLLVETGYCPLKNCMKVCSLVLVILTYHHYILCLYGKLLSGEQQLQPSRILIIKKQSYFQ